MRFYSIKTSRTLTNRLMGFITTPSTIPWSASGYRLPSKQNMST